MEKITAIAYNPALLAEMKTLGTETDVTNFVQKYKKSKSRQSLRRIVDGEISSSLPSQDVIDLANLTSQINFSNKAGYIVKQGDSVVFQQSLSKDLCEQFITTQLVLDLFSSPMADYTKVLPYSIIF